MTSPELSVALVIETHNLHGGERDRLTASLIALLERLRAQTFALDHLESLVITFEQAPPGETHAALEDAIGRTVTCVEVGETNYYEAKNRGFEATRADIVVFADSDCWPAQRWLERLVAPFYDRAVDVVAGRTSYREDLLGIAATTIDFMYFPSPLGEGCTRNFYANNVAFRRAIFAEYGYGPSPQIYRGHCQILGLRLQRAGVQVRFESRAHTVHRFPDSLAELVKLRRLRGADAVHLTPHLIRAYLPRRLHDAPRLATAISPLVMLTRLGFSLRGLNHQHMPRVRGPRRAAAQALLVVLSLIDTAATVRTAGALLAGRDAAQSDDVALAYHDNIDRLVA